jgi:outer membrane protein OmpA-like peptidoglycan-associated protein
MIRYFSVSGNSSIFTEFHDESAEELRKPAEKRLCKTRQDSVYGKNPMKKNEKIREIALIKKNLEFDSPILRHLIKKHSLDRKDSLVLAILLDLTGQGKTDIKTHYGILARTSELSSMDIFQSLNSLHRYRIIDHKPDGEFVHISFNEITDEIEELGLAYINARKIRVLEEDMRIIKKSEYVPSGELYDRVSGFTGRLISEKISEALRMMVNYLNDRIEAALSGNMWKFRYIAFRTGIPLGEVILKESLSCVIDEVLIIEKKTSLLVAHASRQGKEEADRDIVASMLSAIMDFVKVSFRKKGKESGEGIALDEIQFGNSRIIVKDGLSFFCAFVIDGSPGVDFISESSGLTSTLHSAYRSRLRNFDGSLYGLEAMETDLKNFLEKMNHVDIPGKSGRRDFRKLKKISVALLLLFLTWAGFRIKREITDYRLEKKFLREAERVLPRFSHDINVDINGDSMEISGLVSSPAISESLKKLVTGYPMIKETVVKTVVSDFGTAANYEKNLALLEKQISDLQLLLIKQELEKIVIQFPSGSSVMGNSQTLQARRIFEIVKDYPAINFDIIAFNDPTGGHDINRKLAEERMRSVKASLVSMGLEGGRISLTEFNPDVISADPRYSAFTDRRGIMLFTKVAR